MHSLYSYAIKLGGSFHIVKDSEVDGLFELIQFKFRYSRAQAERILHEGGVIQDPGHFQVRAMRKQPPHRPEVVVGYPASSRVM